MLKDYQLTFDEHFQHFLFLKIMYNKHLDFFYLLQTIRLFYILLHTNHLQHHHLLRKKENFYLEQKYFYLNLVCFHLSNHTYPNYFFGQLQYQIQQIEYHYYLHNHLHQQYFYSISDLK